MGFASHIGSTFSSEVHLKEINFSASHGVKRRHYLGWIHEDYTTADPTLYTLPEGREHRKGLRSNVLHCKPAFLI